MKKWYEQVVFYHRYPLKMAEALKQNGDDNIVHRFEELNGCIPHMKELETKDVETVTDDKLVIKMPMCSRMIIKLK